MYNLCKKAGCLSRFVSGSAFVCVCGLRTIVSKKVLCSAFLCVCLCVLGCMVPAGAVLCGSVQVCNVARCCGCSALRCYGVNLKAAGSRAAGQRVKQKTCAGLQVAACCRVL